MMSFCSISFTRTEGIQNDQTMMVSISANTAPFGRFLAAFASFNLPQLVIHYWMFLCVETDRWSLNFFCSSRLSLLFSSLLFSSLLFSSLLFLLLLLFLFYPLLFPLSLVFIFVVLRFEQDMCRLIVALDKRKWKIEDSLKWTLKNKMIQQKVSIIFFESSTVFTLPN